MLTLENIELLLEALQYTRQTFERYPYPDPKLRAARLQTVDEAAANLRAIRQKRKQENQ